MIKLLKIDINQKGLWYWLIGGTIILYRIACIDKFNKMIEEDRVSIHENME